MKRNMKIFRKLPFNRTNTVKSELSWSIRRKPRGASDRNLRVQERDLRAFQNSSISG